MKNKKKSFKSKELFPIERRHLKGLWLIHGKLALDAAEQELAKVYKEINILELKIDELSQKLINKTNDYDSCLEEYSKIKDELDLVRAEFKALQSKQSKDKKKNDTNTNKSIDDSSAN